MGGGGLRILGHKRWHVWRRDNIERVLRDEREHEEQQRATELTRRRREQEQRVDALRQEQGVAPEHINFFKKEEEEHTLALLRAEQDATRAAPATETLGRQGAVPWYASRATDRENGETTSPTRGGNESRRERKRKRELAADDPLVRMRPSERDDADDVRYLHDDDVVRSRRTRRLDRSSSSRRRDDDRDDEGSATSAMRHRKDKQKKKKKKSKTTTETYVSMEELRREREAREKRERERSQQLLR